MNLGLSTEPAKDINLGPTIETTSVSMRPLSVKPKNTGGKSEKEK